MRTQRRIERRARTLHLVDIENLIGINPRQASVHDVRQAFARYAEAAHQRADDQMIVGCNPKLAIKVADSLRGSGRLRARSGADGADTALLEAVDVALWSQRFDRIFIGSGDHIFAPTIIDLRQSGLDVTVVARNGHVSRAVRATGATFRPMQIPPARIRTNNKRTSGRRNPGDRGSKHAGHSHCSTPVTFRLAIEMPDRENRAVVRSGRMKPPALAKIEPGQTREERKAALRTLLAGQGKADDVADKHTNFGGLSGRLCPLDDGFGE